MSGAHEGCSQGKSVREQEGSKHSTAATLERVDSEAAVLPQDFEDTVHARQLKALCRRVGRRMIRQGPGRSPSIGLTHLNAARPREKVECRPALLKSKSLSDLVSRSRATRLPRRTSGVLGHPERLGDEKDGIVSYLSLPMVPESNAQGGRVGSRVHWSHQLRLGCSLLVSELAATWHGRRALGRPFE
jgi:hypothetical protein